ncbi:MAG: NADH-quinone oxidoreductase subunit K [Desulfobacterales bacterium]|nr:NADH-quinone oxidoreductase subunit K [Desulfobacterales bacterium]
MEIVLALLTGTMVAGSVFLMLGRHLVRFIFGLVLASNAVNLLIFAAGRLSTSRPPLLSQGGATPSIAMANSLPQALILTAIVIGFALLVFVFILFYRTYEKLGTVDTEMMGDAESAPDSPSAVKRTKP